MTDERSRGREADCAGAPPRGAVGRSRGRSPRGRGSRRGGPSRRGGLGPLRDPGSATVRARALDAGGDPPGLRARLSSTSADRPPATPVGQGSPAASPRMAAPSAHPPETVVLDPSPDPATAPVTASGAPVPPEALAPARPERGTRPGRPTDPDPDLAGDSSQPVASAPVPAVYEPSAAADASRGTPQSPAASAPDVPAAARLLLTRADPPPPPASRPSAPPPSGAPPNPRAGWDALPATGTPGAAPSAEPVVRIEQIHIVTPPAPVPAPDSFASLSERRGGRSRHEGWR